jgi:hypothetical protein
VRAVNFAESFLSAVVSMLNEVIEAVSSICCERRFRFSRSLRSFGWAGDGSGGLGGAERRTSVRKLVLGDGVGAIFFPGGKGAGLFLRLDVPLMQDKVGDGGCLDRFGDEGGLGRDLTVSSSSSSQSLPNGLRLILGGLGGPTRGVPLALRAMLLGDIGDALKFEML